MWESDVVAGAGIEVGTKSFFGRAFRLRLMGFRVLMSFKGKGFFWCSGELMTSYFAVLERWRFQACGPCQIEQALGAKFS